jgi:hypothetical protein
MRRRRRRIRRRRRRRRIRRRREMGRGIAVFQTPQLYIFPLRAQNLSFILVSKPFVV